MIKNTALLAKVSSVMVAAVPDGNANEVVVPVKPKFVVAPTVTTGYALVSVNPDT